MNKNNIQCETCFSANFVEFLIFLASHDDIENLNNVYS